ncbi:ribosomal L7Ae/L30e/S12e/Gadd45 family protein [Peptococcaceae bacterium 1198_IL3148]
MNKQAANMLGLCQRAGKLLSGDCQVKNSIKDNRAKLVILATDASERTKKDYIYLAKANKIPLIQFSSKTELGLSVGKARRAALSIIDTNFAKGIHQIIGGGEA